MLGVLSQHFRLLPQYWRLPFSHAVLWDTTTQKLTCQVLLLIWSERFFLAPPYIQEYLGRELPFSKVNSLKAFSCTSNTGPRYACWPLTTGFRLREGTTVPNIVNKGTITFISKWNNRRNYVSSHKDLLLVPAQLRPQLLPYHKTPQV